MGRFKILLVTNMCTHYVRPLFEVLSKQHDVEFYFTGGHEAYWHKQNELKSGDFRGTYLAGVPLFGRMKICPELFWLPWRGYDVVIKTIDDRFALPVVFCAAKLFRKPFILWTGLWAHPRTPLHRWTLGLTKFIYRHSDAIVTYGEHVRRYLIGLGVDGRKIFCAPHATDNAAYDRPVSGTEKEALRRQLALTSGENIVLYVGRLEDGKGLEYLIEAAAQLKPGPALVLVGAGSKEGDLRRMCADKGVRVVFTGHVPNERLYLYYAAADIFVLPSVTTPGFKEPWGMVINEAMNQGCPVVTTDAVGAAAGGLVEDGKTGFIVAEKNSVALAMAFKRLLDDENLRGKMGAEGRLKIGNWTPSRAAEGFAQALGYVKTDH